MFQNVGHARHYLVHANVNGLTTQGGVRSGGIDGEHFTLEGGPLLLEELRAGEAGVRRFCHDEGRERGEIGGTKEKLRG